MGRFETAAEFYGSREPYPSEFFAALAARMKASGGERLIDLGCGPAQLALGMAPFVKEVVGVDIEPAMLEIAAAHAAAAGLPLRLMESRVEDLPPSAGQFEIATIGRALHWMDRAGTLAVLDRIIALGGYLAICGSTADEESNRWVPAYKAVRRRWAGENDEQRYRIDYNAWCAGSRFGKVDELRVPSHRLVPVNEIVQRALSMSSTAPATLGERRAEFEAEVLGAVVPFARDGMLEENVVSIATLFR